MSAGPNRPETGRNEIAARRGSTTVVKREGAKEIHESWVRPDGSIERNIRMDLVVAAAGRRASS